MVISTTQALMRAEDLEEQGCITQTARALIRLKNDLLELLGREAYETLMEDESNNISILIKKD